HIVYKIELTSETIALIGNYTSNASEDEQTIFLRILEQAANTLEPINSRDSSWSLVANTGANIFMRIPPNWMRESADDISMTVSETFGDSSIAIRYRDLGRPFELSEIEEQLITIYNSNSYDIQEQTIVNLPSGDALFFKLGDVRVTSDMTHTQLHFIIAQQ